jgi:tetratricopeptide (TPR) repeat protein
LGNSYLMLLDWKRASEYYEKVLEKKENGIEFLSLCALQLACTYSILGKDKEAIEILEKMETFCGKKGRFDEACSRKTKEILTFKSEDQKLSLYSTTFEILFFRRDIAHMSEENLVGVLGEIKKLKELNDDKNVENKAKLAQIVGLHVIEAAILSGLNKKEEGKASYLKAISFTKDIDKSAHHCEKFLIF